MVINVTCNKEKRLSKYHLVLMQDLLELLRQSLWLAVVHTLLADLVFAVLSSVRVESEKYLSVLERVLLLNGSSLGDGVALWLLENGLDFARVDQSVDIGVADNVGWQQEVLLVRRGLGGGTVDVVESLECIGGPDDEATEMTTWCELEQV